MSSDAQERKTEKKEKGLYAGMGGLPKTCKHPMEGSGQKPRALFGIDRDRVKGASGMMY